MDPLRDLEVQRALALSRARESYPALRREALLEYCEAAWEVALRADPEGKDPLATFERALLTIAWTHRRSGGRVPLRELVDQAIPRVALEPFVAAPRDAADEEPEGEPAPGTGSPQAPVAWRSLLRVPFTSPIPVGAAVAAGVVGIALLNEARVLPIAPPQLAGNDDAAPPEDASAPSRSRDEGSSAPAATPGSGGSDLLSSGLIADEIDNATTQAHQAAVAREAVRAAAIEPERAAGSEEATREAAAAGGSAGESAAASEEAAQVAPATQPVVRLQMPEPAIVVEVGAPTVDEEEPDDTTETDGPGDGAPLTGVVEEVLDEDEHPAGDRGEDDAVPDDEGRRGNDGDDRHRNRDVVALEEWLEPTDEVSEEGDGEPVGEESEGDVEAPGGDDEASGDVQPPDGGDQTPLAPESPPVGQESPPVSPETSPAPTETAPAPTAPATTEPAPAAPVPAPAPPATPPA